MLSNLKFCIKSCKRKEILLVHKVQYIFSSIVLYIKVYIVTVLHTRISYCIYFVPTYRNLIFFIKSQIIFAISDQEGLHFAVELIQFYYLL